MSGRGVALAAAVGLGVVGLAAIWLAWRREGEASGAPQGAGEELTHEAAVDLFFWAAQQLRQRHDVGTCERT